VTRTGTCVYCGRSGRVEFDHLSGRDDLRRYVDPQLFVDACGACNKQRHHVWRAAGLDRVAVHPMATRLLRVASNLEKVADNGNVLVLPAAQVAALAALLREAALVIVGFVGALVLFVAFQLWSVR
jgi:hypothetical protein